MSTTPTPNVDRTIDRCRPADVTPVVLAADTIESTAPEYLVDLRGELAREGLTPVRVTADARFDDDCSLSIQREVDRVREYLRAASFLGAGALTVRCGAVADPQKARPALAACAERAEREGIVFDFEGPLDLE